MPEFSYSAVVHRTALRVGNQVWVEAIHSYGSKSKYIAEYKKCARKGWKQNKCRRPSSPHASLVGGRVITV